MNRPKETESRNAGYRHIQRAPLCLLLYTLAIVFFILAWNLRHQPAFPWLFSVVGLVVFVLAVSFHYLKVEDKGDQLSIRFGPLPLMISAVSIPGGRHVIVAKGGVAG